MYDPYALRTRLYLFSGGLRVLSMIFDVWVWYFAKNLKLMEDNEEQEQQNTNQSGAHTKHDGHHGQKYADEIEDEVRALQADGSDGLARKLSI